MQEAQYMSVIDELVPSRQLSQRLLGTNEIEDVAFLLSSPLIPGTTLIRGFVYGVRTGRLNEVHFESAVERK
jgi:carbonic anhydrase